MPKFQFLSVNMLETSGDYRGAAMLWWKSSREGWSLGMALRLELLHVTIADGHKEVEGKSSPVEWIGLVKVLWVLVGGEAMGSLLLLLLSWSIKWVTFTQRRKMGHCKSCC